MTPMRLGLVALLLAATVGCGFIGAPEAAGMTFDGGGSFVIIYEQWRAGAEALVAEAAGKVAESYPYVSVTSVIEQSDPRQLLLETGLPG